MFHHLWQRQHCFHTLSFPIVVTECCRALLSRIVPYRYKCKRWTARRYIQNILKLLFTARFSFLILWKIGCYDLTQAVKFFSLFCFHFKQDCISVVLPFAFIFMLVLGRISIFIVLLSHLSINMMTESNK